MALGDLGNSGGLLGTGICLTQSCKDKMNADNAYKLAEANLINAQASSKGINYTAIIIGVIVLFIVMGVTAYFILKKRNK